MAGKTKNLRGERSLGSYAVRVYGGNITHSVRASVSETRFKIHNSLPVQ